NYSIPSYNRCPGEQPQQRQAIAVASASTLNRQQGSAMDLTLPPSAKQQARPKTTNRTAHWLWLLALPMLLFLVLPLVALIARIEPAIFFENLTNRQVAQAIS